MATSIEAATVSDASEILELQKLCYQREAELYDDFTIPPLTQSLSEIEAEFTTKVFLKAEDNTTIIGSVRAFLEDGTCHIERLIVHPDYQGQGIGTSLLKAIEAYFGRAQRLELFTGSKSEGNIRLYERLGFTKFAEKQLNEKVTLVFLEKVR